MREKLKINKILFGIIMFLFIFVGFTNNVKALSTTSNLIRTPISNMFYERTRTDYYFSYQYSAYDIGGKVAYCIEPGIDITETTYHGSDNLVSISGLSADTIRKVLLYAYYGYQNPNYSHNTMLYRVATQTLIWEAVDTYKFTYHTERYGYGSYVDISREKNEIQRLVDNHYVRPSFNGQTIRAQVGEEVTLTDTNGVLSNYEVHGDNIANVVIDGNKLTFRTTTIGDVSLNFVKKQYTNEVALVHYNSISQKMITRGAVDPVYSKVNIDSYGGQVEFTKNDFDNKNTTPMGEATLKGAVYGLYDSNDVLIEKLTTDEFGYIKSDYLDSFGTYYLQEISASTGYQLDTTKYYFESTIDDLLVTINVYEKVIKREIDITKVYADDRTLILTPEPNIEFGFYDYKGELFTSAITDRNGRLRVSLPYGSYVVKQLNATPNHEKVEDFNVYVTSMGEVLRYVISNAEITAKVKVVKKDAETGDIIARAGIKFKIYDVLNENYVCQTITYPSATTLCEFETDKNGVLITPYNLKSGRYQLEEVDQKIDGYLWNNEKISFEIGDNSNFTFDSKYGVLFLINFTNTRVKGSVELTKYGEEIVYENDSYSYNEILLPNVKYELYANEDITLNNKTIYHKGDLVETLNTNENGYAKVDNLYLGKYYLIEIESSLNNIINDEKIYIDLDYVDQYTKEIKISKELYNKLPKGELDFTKNDLVTGDVIPNVKIEIYNDEDILVYTGYTDEAGKIKITDLLVDKYYIIETETATGYELTDEKIYFEILENGEIIKASMTNERVVVPNTSISDSKVINIIGFIAIVFGIGYIIYDKTKKK